MTDLYLKYNVAPASISVVSDYIAKVEPVRDINLIPWEVSATLGVERVNLIKGISHHIMKCKIYFERKRKNVLISDFFFFYQSMFSENFN